MIIVHSGRSNLLYTYSNTFTKSQTDMLQNLRVASCPSVLRNPRLCLTRAPCSLLLVVTSHYPIRLIGNMCARYTGRVLAERLDQGAVVLCSVVVIDRT